MPNKTGGNKYKKQARSQINGNKRSSNVRISLNENEIYGQVTKFYGNRFDVLDINGNTKNCTIPKKFSGRNAKDNKIAVNTWVLIGKRVWEVSIAPVYDLLEVYTETEKHYLKKNVHVNWDIFESDEKTSSDTIEFGNEENEYKEIIQREAQLNCQSETNEDTIWIDVDDI
jgi:hypothetical protein